MVNFQARGKDKTKLMQASQSKDFNSLPVRRGNFLVILIIRSKQNRPPIEVFRKAPAG